MARKRQKGEPRVDAPKRAVKTELTPELQDAICQLVRDHNFPETAARACGVRHGTWYLWLKKGREGIEPYATLVDALARAQGESEVDLVKVLAAHGKQERGGAHVQWMLEKMNRKRYGAQVRMIVEAELEQLLTIAENVLDSDNFLRLIEAIAAAESGEEAPSPDPGVRPVH